MTDILSKDLMLKLWLGMQMCLPLLMCNIQVAVKFRIVDGMDVQCFNQNKGNRFMQQVRQILYILKVLWRTLASANQTIVQIISLTNLYTVYQVAGTVHRESRPFISNVSIAAFHCVLFRPRQVSEVRSWFEKAEMKSSGGGRFRASEPGNTAVEYLVEILEDVPKDAVVESRA